MNLRAAAQQALNAWENAFKKNKVDARAINIFRAALSEDRSVDAGKTSDQSEDARGMVASVREDRTVEPVAYISGYKQGYCVIEPVDRNVLLPVGMALYRSPPKREPLTDEEIAVTAAACNSLESEFLADFARAIERAHGIGGEE